MRDSAQWREWDYCSRRGLRCEASHHSASTLSGSNRVEIIWNGDEMRSWNNGKSRGETRESVWLLIAKKEGRRMKWRERRNRNMQWKLWNWANKVRPAGCCSEYTKLCNGCRGKFASAKEGFLHHFLNKAIMMALQETEDELEEPSETYRRLGN